MTMVPDLVEGDLDLEMDRSPRFFDPHRALARIQSPLALLAWSTWSATWVWYRSD